MTRTQGLLLDILTPVRDIFLSRMLEEMAAALDRNHEVQTDVVRREETGGALDRTGPFKLPVRADLATDTRSGRKFYDIDDDLMVEFDPLVTAMPKGGEVQISPFRWNHLQVDVRIAEDRGPDWQPLRRWYLEGFQPRFDEDTPEFQCVLHRLSGPSGAGPDYRFEIDLGTASVDAIPDLLEALEQCGARRVMLFGADGAQRSTTQPV